MKKLKIICKKILIIFQVFKEVIINISKLCIKTKGPNVNITKDYQNCNESI